MKKGKRFVMLVAGLICSLNAVHPQALVESVAAIVGNEVIYLSDIENSVIEMRRSGVRKSVEDIRCDVFQELLISKLFLDQARLDSISVTDDMVETDVTVKMNDAIRQVGSEKALEDYFKKRP
jgi:peptidyl-prolyl cis-trans isomerase SurA